MGKLTGAELESKIKKSKSWNLGSLSKQKSEKGNTYRTIKVKPEIKILFDGVELDLKRDKKGYGILNLFQLKDEDKSEGLINAENNSQNEFKVTHDVSAKLDRD